MLTSVDLKHLDIQFDLCPSITSTEWKLVELTTYDPLADVQWNGIRRLILSIV
jgi:hypothetical protein